MAVEDVNLNDVYMALIEENLLDEILSLFQAPTYKLTLYHILNEFTNIPGITKTFLLDLNFNIIDIVFNDLQNPRIWNSAMTMVHNWLCEDDEDIFDLVTKDDTLIKIVRAQPHIDPLSYHELLSQISVKCSANYNLQLVTEEIILQHPLYRDLMFSLYVIVTKSEQLIIYTTALQYIDRFPDISVLILIKIRDPAILKYLSQQWPIVQILCFQLQSRDIKVRELTITFIERILYLDSTFDILVLFPYIVNECRQQTTNAIKLLGSIFHQIPDESLFVEIIRMVDLYNIQLCEEIVSFATLVTQQEQDTTYSNLLKDNINYIESLLSSDNIQLQRDVDNLIQTYGI